MNKAILFLALEIVETDYSERSDKMKKSDVKQTYIAMNIVTQFFLEVFVGMALGYFLGQLIDNWLFEDKQLFVYILLILGMFGALGSLISRALKLSGGEDSGKKT